MLKVRFNFLISGLLLFFANLSFGMSFSGEKFNNKYTGLVPKFGVMIHYLPGKIGEYEYSSIDIVGLVSDLKKIKAEYLIFTLGQNDGFFNSKNDALELICPAHFKDEPYRDIVEELSFELKKQSILFILYLPFRAPQKNQYLMNCLEDISEKEPPSTKFLKNWSQIIEFWSVKFGHRIDGWWFDGTYNTKNISDSNWDLFCTAALSGNKIKLIAFNAGEGSQKLGRKNAPCQNWAAGELVTKFEYSNEINETLIFNLLTPIKNQWGRDGSNRYSNAELCNLFGITKSHSGMLTVDIPVNEKLRFSNENIEFIKNSNCIN